MQWYHEEKMFKMDIGRDLNSKMKTGVAWTRPAIMVMVDGNICNMHGHGHGHGHAQNQVPTLFVVYLEPRSTRFGLQRGSGSSVTLNICCCSLYWSISQGCQTLKVERLPNVEGKLDLTKILQTTSHSNAKIWFIFLCNIKLCSQCILKLSFWLCT